MLYTSSANPPPNTFPPFAWRRRRPKDDSRPKNSFILAKKWKSEGARSDVKVWWLSFNNDTSSKCNQNILSNSSSVESDVVVKKRETPTIPFDAFQCFSSDFFRMLQYTSASILSKRTPKHRFHDFLDCFKLFWRMVVSHH